MSLKCIKTETDYHHALERLEVIFDSRKGSAAGHELEILASMIENYENEHLPISSSE